METAIAAFIRFYNDSGTIGQWQNFFVKKTIDGHAYKVFDVGSIILNRSAAESGVNVFMPTTKANVDFVEQAIEGLYLMRLTLYEMPAITMPTGLNGAQVVGSFVGEIIDAELGMKQIVFEVGSALDAVTGDIPGRKITTSLVGRLPKL